MNTVQDALVGIVNGMECLPGLLTGGQPEATHIERLGKAGCTLVLDLRATGEPRSFDEPATCQAHGVQYVSLPVHGQTLTDETLEQVRGTLRQHNTSYCLVHCGSGNRVGAVLIPHLMLDQKMSEEDAIAMARRVGLQSPELLSWALDYVRRQQAETPTADSLE